MHISLTGRDPCAYPRDVTRTATRCGAPGDESGAVAAPVEGERQGLQIEPGKAGEEGKREPGEAGALGEQEQARAARAQ